MDKVDQPLHAPDIFRRMIDRIFFVALALGGAATATSILRLSHEGVKPNILLDIATYLCIIPLFILRKKVRLPLLAGILFSLVGVSAFGNMLTLGLANISLLMLATCCVLTAIFLDFRSGMVALGVSIVFTVVAGFLVCTGKTASLVNVEEYLRSPTTWIAQTAGLLVYIVLLVTSITELKKRYLQTIKERDEKSANLAAIVQKHTLFAENMTDVVFIQELDNTISYVSPSIRETFGYDPEEVIGKDALLFFEPSTRAKNLETMKKFIAASLTDPVNIPPLELDYLHKNGSVLKGEVRVRFVPDAAGKPVSSQGIIRDITARKKAAAEQERMEKHLRRTEQLQTVGRLAGGIAHDFNNQLTGIIGFAELIKTSSSDPSARDHADHILAAANASAGQIARLLSFARPAAEALASMELTDTVREVLSLLRHDTNKNILFQTDALTPGISVRGNPGLLQNAIFNLCRNAADALPPTGGEIILSSTTVPGNTIPSSAYGKDFDRSDNFGLLTVRDNGTGMTPEILQRLFEPFFTTKDPSGGNGLGLAMTLHAVSLCGGAIAVDSLAGKGSVFSVYVPLADRTQPVRQTADELVRGQGTILVVDDETTVREMLVTLLQSLGYHAIAAATGNAAVELLRDGTAHPDLMILDMIMPGLSAEETFRTIRSLHQNMPVLLVSGNKNSTDIRDILSSGRVLFLQKPFKIPELSRILAGLLNNPE